MLITHLREIGLSKSESEVYLELLKIGGQPASILAKRLGAKRTSLYPVLKSLTEKGLVLAYTKGSVKYFVANDPNSLVAYIDEKYRKFEYFRHRTLSVIPKFRAIVENYKFTKPIVSHCEGYSAVSKLLTSTSPTEICSYLPVKVFISGKFTNFMQDTDHFYKTLSNTSIRLIVPDMPEIRQFINTLDSFKDENKKVLYVPLGISEKFQSFANIYPDKIIMATFDSGSEFAIKIISPQIVELHQSLFNFIWDTQA